MTANYYSIPELAAHYDEESPGRADLPFYLDLAQTLRAERVIDIGCGTGLLCSRLAGAGRRVIGLDPQPTMLDLARRQPNSSAVRWVCGTADDLPSAWADLMLMTGHVAQYFVDDEAWHHVLAEAHRSLQPEGHLAFEIRNDSLEAWRGWAAEQPVPTAGGTRVTQVHRQGDLVTHTSDWTLGERRWTTVETLRFPSWSTMTRGLDLAGFAITESWGSFKGGPIRPDLPEWIILARPLG